MNLRTDDRTAQTSLPMARRRFLHALGCGVLPIAISGCRLPRKQKPAEVVSLPSRHSILADQLVIQSEFRLPYDHPLIQDLQALRKDVSETLKLELNGPPVIVYLFSDEQSYFDYLGSTWPSLPYRRAYFFGNSHELAVYTFWGDKVQEDLRHEFTHGLLNSELVSVPLWLDEGLAEYFEVVGAPGTVKPLTVQRLAKSLQKGRHPDLKRLESLTDVTQMSQSDYEEAWAWMHFLMHGDPDQKQVLLDYLRDLKSTPPPGSLESRLADLGMNVEQRLSMHIASLATFGPGTALLQGE